MKCSAIRRAAIAIVGSIAWVGASTACGGGGGSGSGGDSGGGGGGGGIGATLPSPQPLPSAPSIVVGEYDRLPGCNVVITDVVGGTGANGNVLPGDVLGVRFTVKADDGTDLYVPTMSSAQIYVSGPTSNYQRVIVPQSNVATTAFYLGGGEWGYYLPPMPAVYAAPVNDSPSFGTADGELTGQPLLDGTYTIGLQMYASYEFDYAPFRDAGAGTYDVLVGGATTVTPRAVVAEANCDVCHTKVMAHGGSRVNVALCVLCHTAGSEDKNGDDPATPAVEDFTPGVSVDFKVMIHKIHNGRHLPSVNGLTTDPATGNRVYGSGVPMQYVGYKYSVTDVSDVGFPVFPAFNIQMPRDAGYSSLPSANQSKENAVRTGVVSCDKCHGDPDGAGPATAPAQGHLWKDQPTRAACGSCHDDVDWSKPYTSNLQTMGANKGNDTCALSGCHDATGSALSVQDAHTHPILNPAQVPEIAVNILEIKEAGTNNADGNVDVGEKVQVKFNVKYTTGASAGSDVPLTAFYAGTDPDGAGPFTARSAGSFTTIVAGPTKNYNQLLSSSLPINSDATKSHPAWTTPSGGVYTALLAEQLVLERIGVGTLGLDTFTPARAALNMTGLTTLYRRETATVAPIGSTTITAATTLRQNHLDVALNYPFYTPDTPAQPGYTAPAFANLEYAVIDDGTPTEEYVQVSVHEGNRLWLKTQLRYLHLPGATVQEVKLTSFTTGFSIDGSGQVVETTDNVGAGQVALASYWTDFVVPTVYPAPINDSPDLGEAQAEWRGRPVADGTYTLDCYARVNNELVAYGQQQYYPSTSDAGAADFLVGTATTIEPYAAISTDANCYTCHNDIWFHGGGRRGFNTCVMCHGAAGAEDGGRAKVGTTNWVDTYPKVSISFREMLHKIHMGEELTFASTWGIRGSATSFNSYAEVVFPAWPGGVRQCVRCHGNEAWHAPQDRTHPAPGSTPARVWGFVCGSCHDATAAQAHIDSQTAPDGHEACDVCHGAGKPEDVVKVHVPR